MKFPQLIAGSCIFTYLYACNIFYLEKSKHLRQHFPNKLFLFLFTLLPFHSLSLDSLICSQNIYVFMCFFLIII